MIQRVTVCIVYQTRRAKKVKEKSISKCFIKPFHFVLARSDFYQRKRCREITAQKKINYSFSASSTLSTKASTMFRADNILVKEVDERKLHNWCSTECRLTTTKQEPQRYIRKKIEFIDIKRKVKQQNINNNRKFFLSDIFNLLFRFLRVLLSFHNISLVYFFCLLDDSL